MVPISTLEMGGGPVASQRSTVGKHRPGMRPAGAGRPSPQKPIVDLTKERENAAARHLSVGAAEFSPGPGPRTRVLAGADSDGGGGHHLPTAWTQEIGWDEVMLWCRLQRRLGQWPCPALPGLLPRSTFAGITVPAVAGMKFSAVAEVHSSAVDDDDDTSVVCASGQWSAVSLDPRTAPGFVNRPMKGISVLEPLEHSVLDVALDGRPMEGISVLELLEHSVLDVALDGRPMEGISVLEPLEHSVLDLALDGKPMEGISVLEPLEHSVLEVTLDSRPTQGISVMELLEHSVPDVTLDRGVSSLVKIAVLDPLEHSGSEQD